MTNACPHLLSDRETRAVWIQKAAASYGWTTQDISDLLTLDQFDIPWMEAEYRAFRSQAHLFEAALLSKARATYPTHPTATDEFTVDDPDLNALLNLAACLVSGRANQDTGIAWLDALAQIETRLSASPALTTPATVRLDGAKLNEVASRLAKGFDGFNDKHHVSSAASIGASGGLIYRLEVMTVEEATRQESDQILAANDCIARP